MTFDSRVALDACESAPPRDPELPVVLQKRLCPEDPSVLQTRLYARRWFMLAIFILYAISNIGHWLQYSSISNIVSRYYGVSSVTVDWTSLVFMAVYLPMAFPASYLIDRLGLRWTAVVGCALTVFGSWIKVFSASPERFYVTFIGQVVVSSAQVFVISIPGRLAANWFGASQVSTATAIGLFGCQLAIATNFILPPNIVKDHEELEEIGNDLFTLYLTSAIFATVVGIIVVTFFRSDPLLPPTDTRRLQKIHKEESTEGFLILTKRLLTNNSYLALWHAFGVTIGIFNALGTVLNRMYLLHFQNGEVEAGMIGAIMTIVGMGGSIIAGVILDKTRKFKFILCVVGALSLAGQILLAVGFMVEHKWIIYIGAIIFGFFNGGYSTIGFEVCVEFTYPDPEGVTTAYLTFAHQLYGTVLILIVGKMIEAYGDLWAHVALGIIGLTGLLANVMTKNLERRQNAARDAQIKQAASKDLLAKAST